MLLAVSNWTPDTEPSRLLTQLTNALFQRASRPRGFDPSADVPGWTRFAPAAITLGRVAPRVMAQGQAARPMIKPLAPTTSVASKDAVMPPEERDQLFQEFPRWSRSQ